MTRKRLEGFSLAEAVLSTSFTPRRDDVPELLDLLAGDDRKLVRAAERALSRIAEAALPETRTRLSTARPPLRGRLARLVARMLPPHASSIEHLAALLEDSDPKTRRSAVLALGKVPGEASETILLDYWRRDPDGAHHRAVAEALGKIGGGAALDALVAVETDDLELRRIVARAVLRLSRTLGRSEPSLIDVDRAPNGSVPITLHCRRGIEGILAQELGPAFEARPSGPGRVEARLVGPLSSVFGARTWKSVAFPLPPVRGDLPGALVAALTSPEADAIFRTWTRGAVRYRLEIAGAGHRRALVWQVAKAVAEHRPGLVNDPTGSPWEAVVHLRRDSALVELVPRRLEDPRFGYRVRDVPAASHPTLAAALVRVAGVDPQAVVWDPFVGSGLELAERALAGPYRSLFGSDDDPRALAAARANLEAAGVRRATLVRADATHHVVPGVTLVLTNPPMGRRVARGHVAGLLDDFVEHVGRVLLPGGRFVWVSPFPRRTSDLARRAGLEPTFRQAVDMGGFEAEMQAFYKPRATVDDASRKRRARGGGG